ncbi:DUF5343 domain-containing protein [Sphingomonas sp. JC676]|uniref:DUF5343 domain-containing protein n=1 Tax=Sphingomonas sp. JC676 TaxID=2768065 RepID=UPI001657F83D|nr:DUF5343 domain-containing protein [Sphingomonas sp. JC676]MBC9031679.1 DUF5343 domain-containing protein [Sphingomonas sp. JC676]
MAEKARYPQIPSTVWWGVRNVLQRTPNATIDDRLLGVQLGVQEAAARAYINELRSVGILTDEGRATSLAQRWKLDDTYAEAVEELVSSVYPEGLLHVAPPGEGDRQKIVNWFQREGLGQGAAGNKAATYLLLTSATPNEAAVKNSKPQEKGAARTSAPRSQPATSRTAASERSSAKGGSGGDENRSGKTGPEIMPLNVNVQIHISADAGSEQIESIFSAMRRYLYDTPAS